jgi:hypothetical protein
MISHTGRDFPPYGLVTRGCMNQGVTSVRDVRTYAGARIDYQHEPYPGLGEILHV